MEKDIRYMTGKYYCEADPLVKSILQKESRPQERFKVHKGMQVNLYGHIYKIQVIKPNGDIKCKFLHYDAAKGAKWEEK